MNIIIIGATSEIAKEVGRLYADEKHSFLLIGRNGEKLQSISSDFKARGAKTVDVFQADLDDVHVYRSILDKSLATFDNFDLLVVAHGVLPSQEKSEIDFELVETHARTNYISYISLLTLFGVKFANQKTGSIAVITSVAGDRGRRSNYVYGSFKAGVQAFLEGYSARMSRLNVTVTDVRPGMVESPMTAHLKKGLLFASATKVAKEIKHAVSSKKAVLYTPFFWRYIMLIIRNIPRKIFYKLNF